MVITPLLIIIVCGVTTRNIGDDSLETSIVCVEIRIPKKKFGIRICVYFYKL